MVSQVSRHYTNLLFLAIEMPKLMKGTATIMFSKIVPLNE